MDLNQLLEITRFCANRLGTIFYCEMISNVYETLLKLTARARNGVVVTARARNRVRRRGRARVRRRGRARGA